MALGAGSIAFTGFNADGNDNLAFVTLENIAAGTVITFTDNEWSGSAFNTGESTWTWTATSDVAAGTVVTMDNLAAGQTATSNIGTLVYIDDTARDLELNTGAFSAETVYAYVGTASSPTFLAAITNASFSMTETGVLAGTGLTKWVDAFPLQGADIGAYVGPHVTGGDFSAYLKMINENPSAWAAQSGAGDQSADGTSPDASFPTDAFVIDPNAQKIAFAADSLTVSHVEGNSGATTYTFIVERTNGTTGAVNFSGAFTRGTTAAADYVGGLPPTTFTGTIAEGESSATITITVVGEAAFEPDENFSLTLKSAANNAATVYLSPVAAELTATGTVVNDDTQQSIGFAAAQVFITEGDDGTKIITFTVMRSGNGGTVGDVTFSGTFTAGDANAADFGGTLPTVFSGTILAGETSATVSFTISSDAAAETNESFSLRLSSVANSAGVNVAVNTATRTSTGWILNDDGPLAVHAGETVSQAVGLSGHMTLTIEQGGSVQGGFIVAGNDLDVTIDNAGLIGEAGFSISKGSGRITINNTETGVIADQIQLPSFTTGSLEMTINNAGTIAGGNKSIRSDGNFNYTHLTVNNLATGVIDSGADNATAIEVEGNTTINNAGLIIVPAQAGTTSAGKEGIEYHGTGNVIHNLAGGWIEGSHHAVTGDEAVTVINEAGSTMVGRNGSAVNIDSDATIESIVTVINRGVMQGKSQNYADSDGDAIDVDGVVNVENWGTIQGLGHNGYHKGEPNVSEAIAAGAAVITNHEGGTLYGYGRAIQIDNSSNGDAVAETTIVNAGLIQGDGNLPTGVTPEEVAEFAERIRGGEAINLVGRNADSLTNTGQIIGGVKMGGGDDIIVNKGSLTATGGSAADLGEGNDTFEAYVGSTVTGLIDGGAGDDTLKLIGAGMGSVGANANFEKLDVQSGMWSVQSDAYDVINVATGATVTSQLKLAAEGEMTVAMGGMVIVTNGSDAVVAEGVADIENAGLIQGLGMQGAATAKAIVTNGGTVHNKAGGTILAMGTAIASGAAPAAGVDIVNEGMIQGMMGQAIVLGSQDDSVTNKGMIMGGVDLGAGDDMLSIYTNSSISGAVIGGEGDDTVRLVGTTPSTAGSFNSTSVSSFEMLVVAEGKWSVADQAQAFANIVIEDGATVTSGILLENTDTLKIEHGGKLIMPASYVNSASSPTDVTAIDNAGVISVVYERPESYGPAVVLDMSSPGSKVTLWNREGGMIESNEVAILVTGRGGGSIEINNAGLISDAGSPPAIHARNFFGDALALNNLETGVIRGKVDGQFDVVNNAGQMEGGFQYANKPVTFNNLAGGHIEGAGHAVTGKASITVNNAAGATMVGLNGSAVNIDNRPGAENTVYVRNYGAMEGRSAELSDSDGDAIDTDGLAQILNYGRIAGLGHQGYHDGDANISEGIAIGGGTIVNNAGGEIYGYGRAIQVDDSENGPAFAATTIVNDGLIQGDGYGPEGVDPEDAASVDLRGNEAINLVGDFADTLTNSGTITGGVSMGGGNDTLTNSGTMTATGGSAIDMGAGNDTLNVQVGSVITGAILGGEGNDTVNLLGTGTGSFGATTGFENLVVQAGTWTVAGNASYSDITIKSGATVRSTIFVSGTDHVTIEAGATLTSSTAGSNGGAINWNDVSTDVVIDNYGLVQATGTGAPQAIRVSTTVDNGDPRFITINNHEGGVMKAAGGVLTAGTRLTNGSITINNDGLMEATAVSGEALDFQTAAIPVVINNGATGIIRAHAGQNVIAGGSNLLVNNAGQIVNAAEIAGQSVGGDAIDVSPQISAVINNLSGGLIEGNRHGITGEQAITIVNAAGAIISGRNGSGINFDTSTHDGAVQITNYGTIRGDAQRNVPDTMSNDIDGDGVDVDYTVLLHNYGRIEALGAKGYKQWFENFSEGVAAGGGEIYNHAGASIYSVDHAILIDNGSEGDAYAATRIVNEGLIEGRDGFGIKLVGQFDDTITNSGTIIGGNDTAIDMGAGDDTLNVQVGSVITGAILGGEGNDTVNLLGTGTGSLGATTGFETLVVQSGTWSVDGSATYDAITIKGGASVISTLVLSGTDKLTIEEGGTLGGDYNAAVEVVPTATDVVIDNAGSISRDFGIGVVLYNGNYEGGTGPLTVTITNRETGVIGGDNAIQWYDMFDQGGSLTINNEGSIIGQYEALLADNDEINGPFEVTINNFEGGVISGATREAMKIDGATINNWGTISGNDPDFNRKNVDGIQFTSGGGVVNNYAGTISGARHGITSDEVAFDTYNGVDGLIVGHNGSGVNIDESGTVTNYGIIRGAAEVDVPDDQNNDIDGDGVDIDFDAVVHNYGRIEALGAKGYKKGYENFSEAIAAGGGEIHNYQGAVLYSVDNGILIDDGNTGSAHSATLIENAGIIEGVNGFGIKLVGNFDDTIVNTGTIIGGNGLAIDMGDGGDFFINTRTGVIVGAVAMGGGNDLVTHQGSITMTSGAAFDMGAGNDTLNLHDGSVVVGTIILGTGNDVMSSSTSVDLVIEGGDGQDSIGLAGGDDIVSGGAGIDLIHAGAGEDRIDGGLDNDQLRGGDGDDLIEGGAGNDYIDGGNDDDVIYGDDGHDTILGGLGNDTIKGNAGDDIFVITATGDGRDSYDGGTGIDTLDYSAVSTAVNLTLKDDAASTFSTDTIENIENIIGGSANDKLTGNALDNVLTGNAGDDTLKGMAGNDTLDGGAGVDNLDGGDGNDDLDGGANNDTLLGGAGNDILKGAAGNDVITGGAGNDTLTGGAGNDRFVFTSVGDGIDTITDFKTSGASEDQFVLSASMFQNFSGDDAFDLIGSGFLRAVSSNGTTQIQVDIDGGGDSFVTLATLTGNISNGVLADHVLVHQDPIA